MLAFNPCLSVWTAAHHRICRSTASRAVSSADMRRHLRSAVTYLSYRVSGSTLTAVLSCCWIHTDTQQSTDWTKPEVDNVLQLQCRQMMTEAPAMGYAYMHGKSVKFGCVVPEICSQTINRTCGTSHQTSNNNCITYEGCCCSRNDWMNGDRMCSFITSPSFLLILQVTRDKDSHSVIYCLYRSFWRLTTNRHIKNSYYDIGIQYSIVNNKWNWL